MMKNINWKLKFFTIWAGQAVSLITSGVLQMAIIWYLTNKTGSAMVLSMATLVGFLPQAIFGTLIGVWVDRWSRKLVMIGADIVIGLSGIVLVLISINVELPIWIIMLILFIRSIGTAFHSPALNAVTPLLVPEDQLIRCAGYSQSVQSGSYILSPAIAAFLYANWNLNTAILLDVLGAVIACTTVIFIAIPDQERNKEQENDSILKEAKDGYSVIKEHKGLLALMCVGSILAFIYMPVSALFPLMTMEYFGGTTTHASIVETVFAAGMLLGAVALGMWGGFKNRVVSIVGSLLLMGISLAIAGLLPTSGFTVFVISSGFMGLSSPFYNGVQTALIQEKIQPEYLGRVFGLFGSIISLAMPVGLIISGMLAEMIGVNTWFMISGFAIVGLALLSILVPSIRKLDS
ncbi:MAG: MFS transporter [Tissierella sp.]|nr:MFS transporter [Tissierella sp.]